MKFRMDALHYALLAVVVLLAVYAFGSFREGNDDDKKKAEDFHCPSYASCMPIPPIDYR